jgi:aminomethyltransferase
MKRTAFYPIHERLGAKLVEFGGFEMPVQYSGIIEEHLAVRSSVGVFDVSHMGEFEVSGPDALAFVQRVTTNDAAKLLAGKAQYSAMCYPDGGIVDDLLVYHLGTSFMLVVNASNIQKDFEWLRSNTGTLDVSLADKSAEFSLLAVQGPKASATLAKLTKVNLEPIPYYSFVRGPVAGVEMIISRTGYTGEPGFELYFDSSPASGEKVWTAIMEAGREYAIRPVGLGARDTLRLEMGYCLYGNDIDQTTNPLEAGLGWITKLGKGDFSGREALLRARAAAPRRALVGFVVEGEKAFPRHGYDLRAGGVTIGSVTSGTVSPSLEKGIGLGYVSPASAAPGSTIDVLIRSREVRAQVVKTPFVHA